MKMKYNGVETGRLKKGNVYDVTLETETRVRVIGANFNYTITYSNREKREENWSVEE